MLSLSSPYSESSQSSESSPSSESSQSSESPPSSRLPVSPSSCLPSPIPDHARLIIGLLPSGLVWCIKSGEEIVGQGKAETFGEIRGIQVRAGIWDVVCAGLDRPDLHEAARQYQWQVQPAL